ncbi:hypothetical protein D3C76_1021450 [compost metagenome]
MPSRLQQLRIGGVDTNHLRLHTLLKHRALACIQRPGDRLHVLTELDALRRVQRLVDRECDRGHHAVAESAVGGIVCRHCRTEHIRTVPNSRKANSPIQGKGRDVQHVLPLDLSPRPLSGPEEIPQPAIIVELKIDPRWHQEIQGNHTPG